MKHKPTHTALLGIFLTGAALLSSTSAQEPNILPPQNANQVAAAEIEVKQDVLSPLGDASSEAAQPVLEEKSTEANLVIPTPEKKITPQGASLAEQISRATKEREQRMLAMNEAMIQLTQAGAEAEAAKLERRLKAMIETRDPREDDAVLANKAELDLLKQTVADLTAEVSKLSAVLAQNSRIIDEILRKAVPDVSPAVMDELRNNAKKSEIRKAP